MKAELTITGMSCAACVDRVEGSLARAPGVRSAGVNLATDRATVEYDPAATDIDALIKAVESAGYGARNAESLWSEAARAAESRARQEEYEELRRKFWIATVLSLPVLVIAMAHGRIRALDFPGVSWVQLVLTGGGDP